MFGLKLIHVSERGLWIMMQWWNSGLNRHHYIHALPKVYWIHTDACPSVHPPVRPSVHLQTRFPELFEKLLAHLISHLAFTFMGWVSWPLFIFGFLASIPALWWPNIWPRMGFPYFKTNDSILLIPDLKPFRLCFLTLIHLLCGVVCLIFAQKSGVPEFIFLIPI